MWDFYLLRLLPHANVLCHYTEAAEFPFPTDQPIVGLLPQPGSSGNRQDIVLLKVSHITYLL